MTQVVLAKRIPIISYEVFQRRPEPIIYRKYVNIKIC